MNQRAASPGSHVVRLPPPAGWFVPFMSSEVPRRAVRSFTLAGHQIVIWRTASGQICASDAFCPHLGAHFGHGGTVQDDALRCPFHGFCFNPEGDCVATGYGTTPPRDARLRMWPVLERHGAILVWYHPHNEAPTFEPPDVDMEGWTPWRFHRWDLRGHPQETTENSVDVGHLGIIHGYTQVGEDAPVTVDGPYLRADYHMNRHAGLFGRSTGIRAEFTIHVWGLGYSRVEVHVAELDLRTRQLVFCTCTEDGRAQLLIAISLKLPERTSRLNPALALMPRGLAETLASSSAIRAFRHDVQQDFDIWQNKTWIERPILAAGDGAVMRYRRWARQFYPDGILPQAASESRAG